MSYKKNYTNNFKSQAFLGNFASFKNPRDKSNGCEWTLNTKAFYELGRIQFMFFINNNPSVFELTGNNINEMVIDSTSLSKFNGFLKQIGKTDLSSIQESLNISSKPDKLGTQKPGIIQYVTAEEMAAQAQDSAVENYNNILIIYVIVNAQYHPFQVIGDYQINLFKEYINTLNNAFMTNYIQFDYIKNHLMTTISNNSNGSVASASASNIPSNNYQNGVPQPGQTQVSSIPNGRPGGMPQPI